MLTKVLQCKKNFRVFMKIMVFFQSTNTGIKNVMCLILCIFLVIFYNLSKYKAKNNLYEKKMRIHSVLPRPSHAVIVNEFYARRKSWNLSKLGDVMFKNYELPEKRNRTFVVLIWKFWDQLQKRHVYYLGPKENDPLDGCSVNNCEFTGDVDKFRTADAVLIHIFHAEGPSLKNRNLNQKWIFLNDEAPPNVFKTRSKPPLSGLYDVFNWSMTYASYSDIPVPSGRTVALKKPKFPFYPLLQDLVPYWKHKRRDVLMSILISNCNVPFRRKTIDRLSGLMAIHIYGRCGGGHFKNRCLNHFRTDCEDISHYLFYLAIENSKCRNYMTEKIFHNAYIKGAIPVILGPTIEECEQFLPPNSYLHLDNYATLQDLTNDIIRISENEQALLSYHMWRNHFEISNEHGYFGTRSYHLCRICEALNYNDAGTSIYDEQKINYFLNQTMACRN